LNADTIVPGRNFARRDRRQGAFVVSVMHTRLRGLGATGRTHRNRCLHAAPSSRSCRARFGAAGPAAIRGVLLVSEPSAIAALEYEMDLRGVAREIVL